MNHRTMLLNALAAAKAEGKSRKIIAAKAGVTEVSIWNWVEGHTVPNIMSMTAVINACGYQLKFTMFKGIE